MSAPLDLVLAHDLGYLYGWGGAHKCNHGLMRALAARGHRCRIVAPLIVERPMAPEETRSAFDACGAVLRHESQDILVAEHLGVELHLAKTNSALAHYLGRLLRDDAPNWTLISEDQILGYALLETALEAQPERTIYVSHSQVTLPFGPDSSTPDPQRAALFRRLAGAITVSDAVRRILHREVGIDAVKISFPVYGEGPFPRFGDFDSGYVTIINASAIKGLAIFLDMARQMPDVPFAAVQTWAGQSAERQVLEELPNVRLLAPADDIDEILRQTRLLLVPSLWGEAWGLVVVEAMLRGVPVLASRRGGLPESTLGVGETLPVRPIERYVLRPGSLPEPVVPEQDAGPWIAAARELLGDRDLYAARSRLSREAAEAFLASIGWDSFESYLQELQPKAVERRLDLNGLTPARRALLLRRLRAANARPVKHESGG